MTTLRIYLAPSGQWSGRMIDSDGEDLGGVAGCSSPAEVEEVAADGGMYLDEVVVDVSYETLESRYGWQFQPGRGIDRCTPPDWLPALAGLFAEVEAIIPETERQYFAWSDVKEKRGRLAVDYVAPDSCQAPIEAAIDTAIREVPC